MKMRKEEVTDQYSCGCREEEGKACMVLAEKPEGKGPPGRHSRRWDKVF